MAVIHLLEQATIDKIAAGEVVERPRSIVKELTENAIDAGATAITVEIRDGGIAMIRVTDDGAGIPADQVRTAFLRHATSKIEKVDDLTSIRSFGFRGEALSSIAAVSRVELITKPQESLVGTRYRIEGGIETGMEEIGSVLQHTGQTEVPEIGSDGGRVHCRVCRTACAVSPGAGHQIHGQRGDKAGDLRKWKTGGCHLPDLRAGD